MLPFTQRMLPQQTPQQQYNTIGIQGNAKISWAVTPEEKAQYKEIFKQWDATGLGYLTGDKAREIFLQSGLPQTDLMQIWHLSDPNNNGKLNQDEFAVAMHLIYRKLNGYEIPTTLTAELIPPSTRDLTESVDMLKNYLASDIHNQQLGTGGGSNNYYLKSRSFTNLPVTSHNDATNYKHKDDDIGYVSSSRYKIPSTSLSSRNNDSEFSSSYSSYSSSSSSLPSYSSTFKRPSSIGEDRLSSSSSSKRIADLKKQIQDKENILDALKFSESSNYNSNSFNSLAFNNNNDDEINELKIKIKDIQKQIDSAQKNNNEKKSIKSLLDQHNDLEIELLNMLSTVIPDLISDTHEIYTKIAELKIEFFKLRGSSNGELDIKAKAQAMIQARLAGKPYSFTSSFTGGNGGSGVIDPGRLEEETNRIKAEKASRDQTINDIEKTISKLQDSIIKISQEKQEIENKCKPTINKSSFSQPNSDSNILTSRYTSYNASSHKPSSSISSSDITSGGNRDTSSHKSSSSISSSDTTNSGDRDAYIKAQAERRMQERLKELEERRNKWLAKEQELENRNIRQY
nr:3165_t:CDS:2 [Entrophospora candida]